MTEIKLKTFGAEKLDPEQLKRFEGYVFNKYPEFNFRRRRKLAKESIKVYNKQLIQSHIYSGAKQWDSSITSANRLVKALKNLAAYLKENIKELRPKNQFRKLRLLLQKMKGSQKVFPSVVEIGVMESHGGTRRIQGKSVKIFLLTNKLLEHLGLSLRLIPSGFPVRISKIKPKLQHRKGVCMVCGNSLGHWYRDIEDNANSYVGSVHYLCELPQTIDGVLI